jgi:hypothetical protein
MERDAEARRARIAVGVPALDAINERLASPRLRLESNVAIAQEADEALKECGATRWVSYEIGEITEVRHHYEARGRPGKNTRYRRVEKVPQRLHFSVCVCARGTRRPRRAASHGCWPHVTNVCDHSMRVSFSSPTSTSVTLSAVTC